MIRIARHIETLINLASNLDDAQTIITYILGG